MDYRETLNLPRTSFPMRANLVSREPDSLRIWEEQGIYHNIQQSRAGQPRFILHDGPPYANGHIHLGTALNKILKDFIIKSKTMAGYLCPFVPGWDCHGLPIEHQVEKELRGKRFRLSKTEIRKLCRQYAERFISIQREEFKRLGVFGHWEAPYLTMDHQYEAAILREFGRFVDAGHLYRAKKPVHWCARCQTALAEAEVEYSEIDSPSIYVKFPATGEIPGLAGEKVSMVIWTTTPWTLPANLALALHPEYPYLAVKARGEVLIMAEGRVREVTQALGLEDYRVVKSFAAAELKGREFAHPFLNRKSKVVSGWFVTLESGTGIVHIAPGHGQEDYELGMTEGLELLSPVDDSGHFVPEVEFFGGLQVFAANEPIIEKLAQAGALLKSETIVHSYPHCWRCRNPVVLRATTQWFFSLEAKQLRARALDWIGKLIWIPPWGRDRIQGMVEHRSDWCVSRQRAWGVPIAVFHCLACGEVLAKKELIDWVADLFAQDGTDVWFDREPAELLPPGTTCPSCGADEFKKELDTLDVWFDSGVSFAGVLEKRDCLSFPADLYLEGSDQHRGWFQSSLLAALATRDRPPFKAVLTHGFVVDGKGRKMSKSMGNVMAPEKVIKRYGAEILRLWVAAEDYREDIKISEEILSRLTEAYRRIRNTCRFLLGNLYDFDPGADAVDYEQLEEVDRWILHRLNQVVTKVKESYDQFLFHPVFHTIHNFCAVDLSSLYLDILKDRLYTHAPASASRRSAQTALYHLVEALVRMVAPILSFTAEEVWQHMSATPSREKSVHLATFPEVVESWADPGLAEKWERLLKIRSQASRALEVARQEKLIGNSLEARVVLYCSGELASFVKKSQDMLPTLFIVSQVEVLPVSQGPREEVVTEARELPGLTVAVARARGEKCQRCWNYSDTVGSQVGHPQICQRCFTTLTNP
ncbi:MAG: isoleucine--tRNA ligase [Thermodesulfobacteriota bacterium]